MKKYILFSVVIIITLLTSCTPQIFTANPCFLSDTETEVLVSCYDCPNNGSMKLAEFVISINDTLFIENSTHVVDRKRDWKKGFKYDIKVLDNSIVYVFDFVPLINGVTTESGMPISAAEFYDTIVSQTPELIGTHVLKIEDNEIHDISKIAYDSMRFFVDFYVDLEGREVK
ncbi:MAG: hypothetical protein ACI32H_02455 [Bacilli bacterium]